MHDDDLQAIAVLAQAYFDGIYEGDVPKLAGIFHESSHLFTAQEGKLVMLPRDEWLKKVQGRPSPKSQGAERRDLLMQIDRTGPVTAVVKVRDHLPPFLYTDYLVLVRLDEGWKIVCKTYYGEKQ